MTAEITAGEKPMVSLAFVLAAGTVMSSTGTPPFPPVHGSSDRLGPTIEVIAYDYETQARALQTEMAALKRADGGELTTEHRAYLQKKLVALLDAYNGEIRHVDPMSVNADGSRAR
jgi:hypothetical protein